MMSELVERVKDTLENSGNSPWLPRLTDELAEVGWQNLYCEVGLSSINYGTLRVVARDASAPRRIVARLPLALSADDLGHELQVETFDKDFARQYEEAGVRFYSEEEICGIKIIDRLDEAVNILKLVPTLFTTVAALVKSVHLIYASDDDYDVSFSEPHIPFSIFVSFPRLPSQTGALRVAEAVIHEAMHLQLTLIERIVALTTPACRRYYSPWREEYRDVRGVLHALYVFRVIDNFYEEAVTHPDACDLERSEYIRLRRIEISEQVNAVKSFRDCPELTKLGADFVKCLLRSD
jgi:HEXXH motif-containing protein